MVLLRTQLPDARHVRIPEILVVMSEARGSWEFGARVVAFHLKPTVALALAGLRGVKALAVKKLQRKRPRSFFIRTLSLQVRAMWLLLQYLCE